MKKLLIIIVSGLCVGVLYKFGFIFGGGLLIFSAFLIKEVIARIEYARTIDYYKTMYEDIFVISRHPETNEELSLPGLDHVVVWADYEEVKEEVKNQKEWLRVAKNTFVIDPTLEECERIQIHSIIYQDGEFVNEDWQEEFLERAKMDIKNKRVIRHGLLKTTNPIWYDEVSNRQRGVVWLAEKD